MSNLRIGGVVWFILILIAGIGISIAAGIPFTLSLVGPALYWAFFAICLVCLAGYAFCDVIDASGWIAGIISVIIVLAVIIKALTGSAIFRADEYRQQLGTPVVKEYTTDIEAFDENKAPIINEENAKPYAQNVIGKYGSQSEINNYTRLSVNGEPVVVGPLEHSDWSLNAEGTPGYVRVSATNPENVTLVTEIEGKKCPIIYQPTARFKYDLTRHIRSHGYRTAGLTDYSFEIDDKGWPYWVVTVYKSEIGWGGNNSQGIIVVNATTGEISPLYTAETAPSWIDRIVPEKFFINQLENWGEYIHGYKMFSKQDKLKPTGEIEMVYLNEQCYYYVGLTSKGSDKGTVGFILCNTRTKETMWYQMTGANEQSAQDAALAAPENIKKYEPCDPLPVNVSGVPTYFMPMISEDDGKVKGFAMVDIQTASTVGFGTDKLACKMDYMSKLNSKGNSLGFDENVSSKEIQGKVFRISNSVKDGNTYYFIILEGNMSQTFTAGLSVSSELPSTRDGDTVSIKYNESGNQTNTDGKTHTIDITSFDNTVIQ